MGASQLGSLKTLLVSSNRYAGWCTIAVFVGLVLEYTILLWPKWKDLSHLEKLFTVLAGIAIAGGVYGEYFFGSRASDAALKLESISEERVAELNKEAGEARKAAGKAIERAAELEAELGGRQLTTAQMEAIGKSLRRLAGRGLFITSYTGDPEAARLGIQIKLALGKAGISVDDNLGRTYATRGGIGFGIDIVGPKSDKDFMKAVVRSLKAEGKLLDVSIHPKATPEIRVGEDVVGIMVLLKPLPRSSKTVPAKN